MAVPVSSSCITSIIRVISTDPDLSSKVINSIVSYNNHKRNNNTKKGNKNNSTNNTNDNILYISNKYFTAQVLLVDILTPNDHLPAKAIEDGVILIFNNDNNNNNNTAINFDTGLTTDTSIASFNALSNVIKSCSSVSSSSSSTTNKNYDTFGDLLRLCIGVHRNSQQPGATGNEYSRRILWCLDDSYEYVEADFSTEGQQVGHDERDKDGFARVIEAIEGTVWSSATMHNKNKQKNHNIDNITANNNNNNTERTTKVEQQENNNGNNNDATDKQIILEKKAIVTQQDQKENEEEMSKNREELAKMSLLERNNQNDIDDDYILMDDNGNNSNHDERRKEKEKEQVFNQFEGALREANRIREGSKNNTFKTDEERKNRAEDAALLLMGLMDQIGDLDGESSDGDGNSENDDKAI